LDLFGYDWPDVKRWGEELAKGKRKPTSPSARSAAKGEGEDRGQARPNVAGSGREAPLKLLAHKARGASEGRRGKK
jgi:hypothetical protein